MGIDLPLIWAIIIIFGIMMYVVMDGFDLGIGILFPFIKGEKDRDVMMNTVAPVWDGNETWLVLGGAALYGAFPLAYSVVLSALYLPLIFMLIGLIFRGVAFEFRFKARAEKRHIWDKAFIGGSIAATFFQGVALGAFIDGIPVVNRQYAGGGLDWLSHFDMAVAFDRPKDYEVITHQGGMECCSKEFGEALAKALSTEDMTFEPSSRGVYTDTRVYRGVIPECTNIGVGYYEHHGKDEYLDYKHTHT